MSQLQDARLPRPARAERGSKDASIGLICFNGSDAALSVFGNEPQELLGLSARPAPMSITSSSAPRALSNSSGLGQQDCTTGIPSDYNFPQDFDLTGPQSSQQDWEGYQVNGNDNEPVADPLQRLASAEPEQLPWNPMHLNGGPPTQSQTEQIRKQSSNPRNVRVGQQRSMVGSYANETDEGYYTHSQPDLRSMYSGHSSQRHQARPDQSTIPRTVPSAQGGSESTHYNMNHPLLVMGYQLTDLTEQQRTSQAQQEPFECSETGCSVTCKTMSDLKKHTARHKREHVCDWPGCTRADKGFATINDLERHQKTVHHLEPSHGQSRMYKCFAPNCKQWEKEWPRLDNFKQHLVRMHKTESTEELIRQSNDWYDTKRKPNQPPSISAQDKLSWASNLLALSSNQVDGASSARQQSRTHLSPTWQPTGNAARLQQVGTASRPRHSSFSSQPNPSSRTSPFSGAAFRYSQSQNASFGGNNQTDQPLFSVHPTQLSTDFLSQSSYQIPPGHGRLTSAYTVPNPDTSTLSELSVMSFPSYSRVLTTGQDDLAQIASNFSSDQQPHLPEADGDAHSPSTLTMEVQRPSQSPSFTIDAIKAFIDRNASASQGQNAAFLERIMRAGIEKLSESQHRSVTATTACSSPSVITSSLTSQSDSTNTRQPYRCPELRCTKSYGRPCDLKKHLKRHHKPYGCTFSKCYEKFGSKYDWKRHENSQHFQHECWKCGLCSYSTVRNGRNTTSSNPAQLFYKRSLYATHLQKMHSASPDTIREHIRKQRIGRGCQSRFWCGFCETIIVLHKKGLEGADERFNHIDEHFKKEKDISTWVDMDGSMVKGQQQGVDLEDDDDDDDDQEEEGRNVEDLLSGDGIGGVGTRKEEDSNDEDDPYAVDSDVNAASSAQSIIGHKRSFSKFPSSSSDSRPTQRRRIDPALRRPSPPAAFVHCCQCRDGPSTLKTGGHGEACVMCQHLYCESCTYMDRRSREVVRGPG